MLNEELGDPSPEEDDKEQEIEPVLGNPRGWKLVKAGGYHDPPCDRCIRGKCSCFREEGGGACFNCVKMKCQCEYLKNGMYFNDSGSEEVELSAGSAWLQAVKKQKVTKTWAENKGKGKGKGKASRDVVEESDEDLDANSRWVDIISEDKPVKKEKKPIQAHGHVKLAAAAVKRDLEI